MKFTVSILALAGLVGFTTAANTCIEGQSASCCQRVILQGAEAAGSAGIAVGTGCRDPSDGGNSGFSCPDDAPIAQCCGLNVGNIPDVLGGVRVTCTDPAGDGSN